MRTEIELKNQTSVNKIEYYPIFLLSQNNLDYDSRERFYSEKHYNWLFIKYEILM
jgi:hypothetical protein